MIDHVKYTQSSLQSYIF